MKMLESNTDDRVDTSIHLQTPPSSFIYQPTFLLSPPSAPPAPGTNTLELEQSPQVQSLFSLHPRTLADNAHHEAQRSRHGDEDGGEVSIVLTGLTPSMVPSVGHQFTWYFAECWRLLLMYISFAHVVD